MDCTGLCYTINLKKWMKLTEKKAKTIFVFIIKSNSCKESWVAFKRFSELKAFNKTISTITQAPGFPSSYSIFSNVNKRTNSLKVWLQNVINLAKKLEPIRMLMEEQFEVNDLARHITNRDTVMVEYLLGEGSLSKKRESDISELKSDEKYPEKKELKPTHLHMAAAWGDTKCVKILVESGYRVDAIDNYDFKPVDIARLKGKNEVVSLLSGSVAYEAPDSVGINAVGSNDSKSGDIVRLKGNNEVVSLLSGSMAHESSDSKLNTVELITDGIEHKREQMPELPTVYTMHPLKRRFLVLVNPFAGVKTGVSLWENVVRPIFDEVQITYEVLFTTHQGHAKDYIASLDCSKYETVLIISGDGLLFEVLNGLKHNKEGSTVFRRLQIGILPAGSGNAIAGSLGYRTVLNGTRKLIKGRMQGFDLLKVKQPGNMEHLAIIFVSWGIIAACDFDSEKYFRWMGEPRFTMQGVLEIAKKRDFQGRVFARKQIVSEDEEKAERDYIERNPDWWKQANPTPPPGWKDFGNTCYNLFHCGVTPYIASTSHFCREISVGDGWMQLILVRNASRKNLTSLLLAMDDGTFINHSKVEWQLTKSCVLVPSKDSDCLVDVDGERFKTITTHMEVIHNAVSLCC